MVGIDGKPLRYGSGGGCDLVGIIPSISSSGKPEYLLADTQGLP
jgi:hypothetical protein|tara:strand:- start:665 stop:796 length:132 start_codon:yes stop_codon:yes gene_type:complete